MSEFVKRPTAEETDDDLLRMQADWEKTNKLSAQVHRVKKSASKAKAPSGGKPASSTDSARFVINLENIAEEGGASNVFFPVQERNADWLEGDKTDEMLRESLLRPSYSAEDGFPEPLELSAYFSKSANDPRRAPAGKSFFAAEFDRLRGDIGINLDEAAMSAVDEPTRNDDFGTENDRYIAGLDLTKIYELKHEIEDKLDPKMIEFLKSRRKTKKRDVDEEKPKVSKFKARRQAEKESRVDEKVPSTSSNLEQENADKEKSVAGVVPQLTAEEMLNELEVLDEFGDRDDQQKYNRLATDAVHLDFAAKFGRNVAARQEKNALRLFESCKFRPDKSKGDDVLVEKARLCIDAIKVLYLEEVLVDDLKRLQFAKGLSPILDGCWTLVPVRSVVDVVDKRRKTTKDDVEIVRLALLWTVLMFEEKTTAFYAFADPNEFFVRLAEVFLIGPEVIHDEDILACVDRLVDKYIIKAAKEGRICLRMTMKIAGLDAFMPFYEDLLAKFEQYSLGNVQFTKLLLIAAYMNEPISDSIEYRLGLWSPKRKIVRQMTVRSSDLKEILEAIKLRSEETETAVDEAHYIHHTSLLGAYGAAIRDDVVTRDRNELMFSLAAHELGKFVARHTTFDGGQAQPNRKQLDLLVEIVRSTVRGKLSL